MEDDLVPLTEPDQPTGFDVVLRGYDRRQVDDYLDRVEVALSQADGRHAEDAARLSALEQQLAQHQARLDDAECRAEGRPEPVTVAGDRIAMMLRLAEEESAALRTQAAAHAEALLAEAQESAGRETATRSSELDSREQELRRLQADSDKITVQAQKDAESIRNRAQHDAETAKARATQEADVALRKAQDDVRRMHEAGQQEAAAMTAEARRQVEDLSRQRDAIAAQLQTLRDTLSGAVGPLGQAAAAAGGAATSRQVDQADQATQAMRLPDAGARTESGG